MLIELFLAFFQIGLVSFGGGYAMLPLIDREVTGARGWISPELFVDIVAVAGMSPGPIATNTAIMVGYNVANVPGAIAATLGMVFPSLFVILIVAMFFFRIQQNPIVQSAFYGLRPVITGLIFYAALAFTLRNEIIVGEAGIKPLNLLFLLVSLALFFFTKIHPVFVIALSGIAGILVF